MFPLENERSTNCGPSLLLDPPELAFHDDWILRRPATSQPSPTRRNERSANYGPHLVINPLELAFSTTVENERR